MAHRTPRLLVNVDVDDLARAEHFYTSAFGLRVGRRIDGGFVELLGADAPLYLLLKPPGTSPAGGARARTYERHWTPVHLDFVVDDLEGASTRLLAAGATCESPVTEEPYGKLARFADPFGHGLCLVQFNDLGYDAYLR